MKDITDQVIEMDKSITSAIMNTKCEDPIVAVISLSKVLCELLVGLGMAEDDRAIDAFRDTLMDTRKEHANKEVH
jgi:hypothetical protein